ncbi:MAG: hypothetical protein ACE5Q4_04680 [Nitrosopumilus sp.]|jgi:hypothetical protein
MNRQKIKKRYQELRFGHQTIGPIIQLANFLMISYLAINELIPIYIFAPMFVVGLAATYTLIGNKFRKIQQSTDLNLSYQKSTDAGKTTYEIMKRLDEVADKVGLPRNEDYENTKEYVKKIGNGEY